MWSDEFPDPVIPNFEKATGIKINQTPFSQNEEQINKLQATGGEGFDLCQPTCNRAPQYKDLQVLAPFDTNKLKNMSATAALDDRQARTSLWTWEDGLYHLPHCWGSEAISYRTDLYKGDPDASSATARCGTTRSRAMCRAVRTPILLSIGLWWDGNGKMPSNRMRRRLQGRRQLQEDLGSDPGLRHRAQGLGQAVLGFGRQHQVGPDGERRVDRPDLGRPAADRSRRKASRSTTGAEGRRHRLARRPVADEVRQERRPGLRVPQLPAHAGSVGRRLPKARATIRSSPAPMR